MAIRSASGLSGGIRNTQRKKMKIGEVTDKLTLIRLHR